MHIAMHKGGEKVEINRMDALIMTKLNKNKALNALSAMTINELNDYGGADRVGSRSHVVRRLQFLEETGYIAKGLKSGNSTTYYVTGAGLGYLEMIKQCGNESVKSHESDSNE